MDPWIHMCNGSFVSSWRPRSITNAKVMTALVICLSLGTKVRTAQAVALAWGLMGAFGNNAFKPRKA